MMGALELWPSVNIDSHFSFRVSTVKKRNRNVALILAIIGVLCVLGLLYQQGIIPRLATMVTSGWEIYDQIVGARANDIVYARGNQFTTPNFISGALWLFDIDDPSSGVPTMQIQIGDIHHVDFSGKDIPNNQAAESLPPITRGNKTYYLDDHIYLFTVTIRSLADVQQVGMHNGLVPVFSHETDWPYTAQSWVDAGVVAPGKPGSEFFGGAYVAFVIDPWRGPTSDNYQGPANTTLTGAWAGVMNAYVLDSPQQGQISNQYGTVTPDDNAKLVVTGGLASGNQVPMFLDDNSFATPAPLTNFDEQASPDLRIPSAVALYLPINIYPGCKTHASGGLWVVDALYPADGYIMYNVRLDVLQTHEFTLQTAVNPPNPQPPSDYYT